MISVTFTMTGGKDIQAKLSRRSGAELNKTLKKATREAAKALKPYIQALAPVSAHGSTGKYAHTRGNLRRSVRVAATKRQTPGAYVGPSRKKAFYRGWVIRGTKHMHGNSFVARGAHAGMGQAENVFHRTLLADVKR